MEPRYTPVVENKPIKNERVTLSEMLAIAEKRPEKTPVGKYPVAVEEEVTVTQYL